MWTVLVVRHVKRATHLFSVRRPIFEVRIALWPHCVICHVFRRRYRPLLEDLRRHQTTRLSTNCFGASVGAAYPVQNGFSVRPTHASVDQYIVLSSYGAHQYGWSPRRGIVFVFIGAHFVLEHTKWNAHRYYHMSHSSMQLQRTPIGSSPQAHAAALLVHTPTKVVPRTPEVSHVIHFQPPRLKRFSQLIRQRLVPLRHASSSRILLGRVSTWQEIH